VRHTILNLVSSKKSERLVNDPPAFNPELHMEPAKEATTEA